MQNTQTRTQTTNVSVTIDTKPRFIILQGVVHSVPEHLSTAEYARELRSGN